MTSTQLQNALSAANTVNEVNTSTIDTPDITTSGDDDENTIQDIVANTGYPTHEWLGNKCVVINEVCDPYVKAKYKILVQDKLPTTLFDSGASISVMSNKINKHLTYAVKLLKHETAMITASGSNLGPVGQCYLTF